MQKPYSAPVSYKRESKETQTSNNCCVDRETCTSDLLKDAGGERRTSPIGRQSEQNKQIKQTNQRQTNLKGEKPKILVLADSHGRGLYGFFSELNNFNVQVVFKPNGVFAAVVEDVVNLTRDFVNKDFVIIIGGTNGNPKHFPMTRLIRLIKNCSQTKIIICSVPYRYDSSALNDDIYQLNQSLTDVIYSRPNKHVSFVNVNLNLCREHYTKNGLHLNSKGKGVLVAEFVKVVKQVSSFCEVGSRVRAGDGAVCVIAAPVLGVECVDLDLCIGEGASEGACKLRRSVSDPI